jgi:hypothetical protein
MFTRWSHSSDDVVWALADVTRRSIGVTAGEIVVHPSGKVESRTWPDNVPGRLLRQVDLVTGGDNIGLVGVQKVTRLSLKEDERALTRDLGIASARDLLERARHAGR